jgi:MFS family permease
LSFDPFHSGGGALWLIDWRIVQAVGGSMLTANSAAILTDAFPAEQRGMALGVNQITALAGQFLGLVVGGLLAEIDWRAVFWVSVPFGLFGTVWSYRSLREVGRPRSRLGRQCHFRRGSRVDPRGHHLRHPALRRSPDRVDQSVGAGRHCLGCGAALDVLHDRGPGRGTDVPARAVPDPGVRRR